MRIEALEIDGYGVWSGLRLEGLGEGLSVLFGPNEAGKTTLLWFIRAVLYGFSPQRRRYFPPVHGGRPGGWLEINSPQGRFQIARYDAPATDQGGEQLILTGPDGTRQGEHFLKVLLANVDEATFNNVFAVGLRELQELGTLSDTEAAKLLYRLTAGLDRVSLVDVIGELEASRNRLLHRDRKPCEAAQLLAERERLRAEIEELAAQAGRYARLAAERRQCAQEVAELEEQHNRAAHQARIVELAIALHDRWQQRAALEDQLAALGPPQPIPPEALERLDALNSRLKKHQRRLPQLRRRCEQLRAEADRLPIHQALGRQAARIEALCEQQSWLESLQAQVGQLEAEVAQLQHALVVESERAGLAIDPQKSDIVGQIANLPGRLATCPTTQSGGLPAISSQTFARLRAPAAAVRAAKEQLLQARQAAASAAQTAREHSEQIAAALSLQQQTDLSSALDRAGNLVAQLRRRCQLEARLEQLARHQTELEEQTQQLLHQPLLPIWVLAGLGGVFGFGVLLVLVGLFLPGSITGALGWSLALLGLAGTGTVAGGKVMLERSHARQLDDCRRQITILQAQAQQAQQERETLDRQLPGGGSPANRLAAAEKELAALEELVPLEGRRAAAVQEQAVAERRAEQAKQALGAARARWREGLSAAGLPAALKPRQLRQLGRRWDALAQSRRRWEDRQEELQRRRRELDSLRKRIEGLAAEVGMAAEGVEPAELLRRLGEALAAEQAAVTRAAQLRSQARQARRRWARHRAAIGRLRYRRRLLLLESGAKHEQDFRQRAACAARAEMLRGQRAALDREIAAAAAEGCPEDVLRDQLDRRSLDQLQSAREELLDRAAALERRWKERLEQGGQLGEQLKSLTADRRLAERQLDLAIVEQNLAQAMQRWQVLALASRALENIRATYEQQRQPETLCEASQYLACLTQGRYGRVWTPLGQDVLNVDDAEGRTVPVERLSRGTREQLFLSLRLALAACFARRGAALPLILDDVLVNFDAARAKAVATVLRDFAAAGHQLLVFTCHEHMVELFSSLKVPVRQLPEHTEAEPAPISFEPVGSKRARAARRPPTPRPKAAEPAQPDPTADTFADAEGSEADGSFDADFFDTRHPQQQDQDEAETNPADTPGEARAADDVAEAA